MRASAASSTARPALDDIAVAPAAIRSADAKAAEPKSADAKAVAAKAADTKIAGDETVVALAQVKSDKVEGVAAKTETRATRFSDALTGNSANAAEPHLDTDHDVDAERLDEGPDPRWIADLARSAGATPFEEAAQRVKDWLSARARQLATINPSRGVRKQLVKLSRAGKSRLASLKPLTPPAAKLDAILDADSSRAGGSTLSSLASSLEPMGSHPHATCGRRGRHSAFARRWRCALRAVARRGLDIEGKCSPECA